MWSSRSTLCKQFKTKTRQHLTNYKRTPEAASILMLNLLFLSLFYAENYEVWQESLVNIRKHFMSRLIKADKKRCKMMDCFLWWILTHCSYLAILLFREFFLVNNDYDFLCRVIDMPQLVRVKLCKSGNLKPGTEKCFNFSFAQNFKC